MNKKLGKKLEKKSDKKMKRLAKYVWKSGNDQLEQDLHRDLLDMQCICSRCTKARRPRPKKLFFFNLFSCGKGGLRFGPAGAEGVDTRSLKRYLRKKGHSKGEIADLLRDKNFCTRKLWQMAPFLSTKSSRYNSSSCSTTTSSSNSGSSSSSGSGYSSSSGPSSEDSSDTDDDDMVEVVRRPRRGSRTRPAPPPTRATGIPAPGQAPTALPPPKQKAPTSGSFAPSTPSGTPPSNGPAAQPVKRPCKNVRFSSQNLPSPPMKKTPKKKPAGPVRGILRGTKKGSKPGRVAAAQPPPQPRYRGSSYHHQQTPRGQQTPVAPASRALWRHAENQRQRRWQDTGANADDFAMTSPMPPPRNDTGRDYTYSGGALYYYWGSGPDQYSYYPSTTAAAAAAAAPSEISGYQQVPRATTDRYSTRRDQAGDEARTYQGWREYGDRRLNSAAIRVDRRRKGGEKRGYEKRWHSD
ncbi:hypothetical protein PG997_009705 [Apiospora hydei]|uniref:Uncharacterized protein n=1 Tax=Apiospora hydei TaxID=1337664 RepID=A0ABR1VV33_9PEZI